MATSPPRRPASTRARPPTPPASGSSPPPSTCSPTARSTGPRTREIAARAGVSQPSLNYHFRTKDELWRAAVDGLFAKLDASHRRPDRRAPRRGPASPRPSSSIRDFIAFSAANPQLHRIITQESKGEGERIDWLVDEHVRPLYELTTAHVRAPRRARAPCPTSRPPYLYYLLTGAGPTIFVLAPECRRLAGFDPPPPDAVAHPRRRRDRPPLRRPLTAPRSPGTCSRASSPPTVQRTKPSSTARARRRSTGPSSNSCARAGWRRARPSAAAAGAAAAGAGVAGAGPLHLDAALHAERGVGVRDRGRDLRRGVLVRAGGQVGDAGPVEQARLASASALAASSRVIASSEADSIDGGSAAMSVPCRVSTTVSSTPGSVGWVRSAR